MSTDGQVRSDTPERQRAGLDSLATVREAELVERIELLGVSGTLPLSATAEGRRLLELARERAFSELWVHDVDRVPGFRADDPRTSAEVPGICYEAGAVIVEASTGMVYDPRGEGNLLLGIKQHVARAERKNIESRTLEGRRQQAARGRYAGSAKFWWLVWLPDRDERGDRLKTGRWTLDERGAELAVELFERVAHWETPGTICVEWNRRGIPSPRGKRWTTSVLHYAIRSRAATGAWTYYRKPIKVPAIVSEELWERANRALDSRRRTSGRKKRTAPFACAGRVWCPCGKRLYRNRNSLVCATVHRARGYIDPCRYSDTRHKAALIDEVLWQEVCAAVSKPEILAAAIGEEDDGRAERHARRLEEIESELRNLSGDVQQTLWREREGLITSGDANTALAAIKANRTRLEGERALLRQELRATVRAADLAEVVEGLRSRLDRAEAAERKGIIESFVPGQPPYGVTVHPDGRLEIRGLLPIPRRETTCTKVADFRRVGL